MTQTTASGLLVAFTIMGLLLDTAAAYAWYVGKPWHVIFGLILIGALNHPAEQPTLRKWAKGEEA